MIFLVLSGKMIFLFLENIILFFKRKMKDDLSKKNAWKYDVFFKCSGKMVFPKKSHWNMIFLVVLSGKMTFLFPENFLLTLFFRWIMKNDLSQKNTWKYNIFLKCPKKMVFPKKIALKYDLSCIIWKDSIFFPENIFFFWSENGR